MGGVLLALTLVACGRHASRTPAPVTPRQQAAATPGKVVVLIDDVATSAYAGFAPSQCAIAYDVFNNSGAEVRDATVAIAGHAFAVAHLQPRDQYFQDQVLYAAPVAGSCVGVAKGLIETRGEVEVPQCAMGGAAAGDCATRFSAVIGVDDSAVARIQRNEGAARQALAEQLRRQFLQARTQAWAVRGKYETRVGGALVQTDPIHPIQLMAVIGQSYDPSKPVVGPPPEPSTVKVCHLPSPIPDNPPAGRLTVLAVLRDQYDLAVWYRFHVVCTGWPDRTIWLRAAVINSLMKSGQLQHPPPPGAVPPPPISPLNRQSRQCPKLERVCA